jgi:hypothetical protein
MKKLKQKDPHAVALGRKGGKARREKLTPERRSQIAHDAVEERWRLFREAQTFGGKPAGGRGRKKDPAKSRRKEAA